MNATDDLPRLLGRLSATLRCQEARDVDLLQRFTAGGDEEAFAELVRRHGPLVLGVCRRILHDAHAAEDAFQATFLLLARRARRLGGEGSLAGWLHAVAWRTARQALRTERRRRRREQAAARAEEVCGDDLAWGEVRQRLDAELARLPARYRTPLVLCYLEGLTQPEAARRLGWSEGVLRGRLDRGRAVLRKRLAKWGLPAAPLLVPAARASVPAALHPAAVAAARLGLATAVSVRRRLAVGLLMLLVAGVGAVAPLLSPTAPPARRLAAPPARPHVDHLGDPLPAGALLRLGTLRHRYMGYGVRRQVLRDGRILLHTPASEQVFWIDGDTGRFRDAWTVPRGREVAGFSPDGRLVLLHERSRSLQLWDLTTRRQVRTLQDPGRLDTEVLATFSPDGRTVATIIAVNGIPGLLRVWDVATGRPRWQEGKFGQPRGAWVMGFQPDSRVVVLLDHSEGRVRLRETATGKEVRSFVAVSWFSATNPQMTPDGKALLFPTREKTIRSWDLATGKERPPLRGHSAEVWCVASAADSRTVVSAGGDSFALVWDWPSGKLRRRIDLSNGRVVTYLALSADGRRLEVRQPGGGAAGFYDLATGKPLPGYSEAHTGQVQSLAVTPGQQVVSGSTDGTLRLWDLRTGRQVRVQHAGFRVGPTHLSLSADGRLAATGDINEGQVKVFEVPTGRLLRVIESGGKSISQLRFLGRTHRLLIDVNETDFGRGGRPRRALVLWDVDRGRELRRPTPLAGDWTLSLDGRLRAGTREGRLRVWEMDKDRECRVLPVEQARSLVFAPDGRTLACEADHQVVLWERCSARPRWKADHPAGRKFGTSGCFSPDGRWLAVASGSRIDLRETLTGRKVHTFHGHADGIGGVAFTPDGRRVVSGSTDTTLLVWDVAGVLARQPPPQRPDATALARAWRDLGQRDPARAAGAMALLIDSPAPTLDLLKKQLRLVPAADGRRIERLLAGLDSDDFARREQAGRELEQLDEQAAGPLRRFLAGKPSPEALRRGRRLLRRLEGPVDERALLRRLRALEVLERIGSAEALRLLVSLAGGGPAARLTRDAAAAAERLRR